MKYLLLFFSKTARLIALVLMGFFLVLALFFSYTKGDHTNIKNSYFTTIILDVSLSMNVQDGDQNKNSRISVSKNKISQILGTLPHDFGLTIFSGNPQRVIPHSSDKNLFITFLQSVDRANVSEGGTDIGGALQMGIGDFLDESSGNIILFTDGGEQNIEDIKEIREILQEKEVSLFVIGVGTKTGGNIPVGNDVFGNTNFKTYKGKRVTSVLNEKSLKDITVSLGGTYRHISDIEDVSIFQTHMTSPFSLSTHYNWFFTLLSFGVWVYILIGIFIHKNIVTSSKGKK